MTYREFSLTSCTGAPLFARAWETEGKPLANFVLVHGLGEHCGRYKDYAEYLASQGYNVYTYDYLGFGKSPGKRGHIENFDIYFSDIKRCIDEVKKVSPEAKIIVQGHSLGGLIALAYGLKFVSTVDGVVVTSPGLRNNPIPWYVNLAAKIFGVILPAVSMNNRLPADKLSHDQAIVQQYLEDPLVHGEVTPLFFKECVKTMEFVITNAVKFTKPLMLLYAGEDHLVNIEGTKEFIRNLPPHLPREIDCYDKMYHELLNEVGKEEIWVRITRWTKEQVQK